VSKALRVLPLVMAAGFGGAGAGCDAASQANLDFDAGGLAQGVFACDAPTISPSRGSCVTATANEDAGAGTGDAGAPCNPVTNIPCAAGLTCDSTVDSNNDISGFACFGGPNEAALCEACNTATTGPLCTGGLVCANVTGDVQACAHFCCTDADCGTGRCVTTDGSGTLLFGTVAPGLGLCAAM
jgi:hypothetical protein